MNEDISTKCTVENRFVKPCINLEDSLGDKHQNVESQCLVSVNSAKA